MDSLEFGAKQKLKNVYIQNWQANLNISSSSNN